MKRKGFTLVELVAVIAIIAILMLIAVPRFSEMTKNARIKTVEANHRIIISALHSYEAGTGDPFDVATAPVTIPVLEQSVNSPTLNGLEKFLAPLDFDKVPFTVHVITVDTLTTTYTDTSVPPVSKTYTHKFR